MERAPTPALRRLAAARGVQTSYRDVHGRVRRASPAALLAVLRSMGVAVDSQEQAPAALARVEEDAWGRLVEPVVLAPGGRLASLALRVPAATRRVRVLVEEENGARREWAPAVAGAPVAGSARARGRETVRVRVPLAITLPLGRHHVVVEAGRRRAEATLLAAPRRAPAPTRRDWGLFAPLYALRSKGGFGHGDLSDLAALARFVRSRGGGLVATLPLLAAFLDEPFDPSPYSPVSRRAWNELYLAVDSLPEATAPEVRDLLASEEVVRAREALRAAPLVEYRLAAAIRRKLLAALSQALDRAGGARALALDRFLADRPAVLRYARWRAVAERRRASGAAAPDAEEAAAVRAFAYAQWCVHLQLSDLAREARGGGAGLYLDFPLGAHPDGFDVQEERDVFARDASVGAPPDSAFPQGQDWGFPPVEPDAARADGHRHLAECLRHHLEHATVLRVDHVMGLHRLFWIPRGFDKADGVYVRGYPEEAYAVASLEASRTGTVLAGEDLGTVPAEVRTSLARHGWLSTYVVEYAVSDRARDALPPIPASSVACVETHDMPPFAGWWRETDIPERVRLGLLAPERAAEESRFRERARRALVAFLRKKRRLLGRPTPDRVLRALHAHLAASPAASVLVNLEDLWGETDPQNVPGTWMERPNWRRPLAHGIEDLDAVPGLPIALEEVDKARRGTVDASAGRSRRGAS